VDLVNRGVYDGLVFHRVVRDPEPFVVQGGDPQSKDPSVPAQQLGTGSFIDPDSQAPRYIPLEIMPAGAAEPVYSKTFEEASITEAPELAHTRGAVAMARSQAVDSASAQFYITLAELPFLDGSYAVFGYVTSGMDVVDAIQQGDRIESARVVSGLENLKTE
jgi:peptidyl-prolyl cis-trans isomerase B (cyclophilin B)